MSDILTTQSATLATIPTATKIATREVTYSGDTETHIAPTGLVTFSGSDDAKTATDVPAGGGVEAAALRVTIANDSTGVLSVDDNGATLSVDDGGGTLTVDATSLPLPTGASTSANQTTIIGHLDGVEGLLGTIDADTGNLAGDIDAVMDTVASAITGAHAVLDTRAVLFAVNPGGTYGNIERTTGGNLKVAVEEFDASLPAGTNNIGDVDVLSVVPGTGATSLGKAEDTAHSSGDTGVMVLAVRNDAGTALAGTTGDYIPLSTDANGALRVSGASGTTQYAEDTAHASGDSGVAMLVVRKDTAATIAGTDGDYTIPQATATGALRVAVAEDETASSFYSSLVRGVASITDGSSTQVLAAAGASVRNFVQGVSIANTSASTVTVDLRDGTAGSVMFTFIAPAGGGVVYSFGDAPLRGSANTAVAADPSASASTVTVSIHGFTGA
jgi:hypothetical protein